MSAMSLADVVPILSRAIYLTDPDPAGLAHGRCPLHAGKTARLAMNVQTGRWYCFACHTAGDLPLLTRMVRDGVRMPTGKAARERIGDQTPAAILQRLGRIERWLA